MPAILGARSATTRPTATGSRTVPRRMRRESRGSPRRPLRPQPRQRSVQRRPLLPRGRDRDRPHQRAHPVTDTTRRVCPVHSPPGQSESRQTRRTGSARRKATDKRHPQLPQIVRRPVARCAPGSNRRSVTPSTSKVSSWPAASAVASSRAAQSSSRAVRRRGRSASCVAASGHRRTHSPASSNPPRIEVVILTTGANDAAHRRD